ncbi:MAG: hypothetical protein WBV21_20250 [Desulfobacterales bacterium]
MVAMGSPPGLLSFAIRFDKRRHTADVADAAAIRWTTCGGLRSFTLF